MIYASTEAHATIARAARIAGFGDAGVRRVPVDAFGRMKVASLRAAIADDRATGAQPFLIVATVGTTAEGAIDPVEAIADVAEAHACWLHADCAWGGLLAFIGARSSLISSLARADSIAFDLHKAFAIPLGVGAFLTRRQGALHAAFAIEAGYMPRDRGADPYAHGLAWSRRFAGLELHALIGRVGWDGIAASLRRQIAVADHLRASLEAHGWRVVNETPLPNVCFVDASTDGASPSLSRVARDVVDRGSAWISVVKGANGRRSLRACIGNPATRAADVDALVTALDDARVRARS
jgi:glutamate/tyrosine decarboxylase-like PLP-dependent enzyme